ncbi:MAG: NAD(P)/FAD-dependent oxidoreductase [Myxococcales bacterium]|nr:NAD(P)/FAD-dependent oxidoreductase [Myxococcales bacterium]
MKRAVVVGSGMGGLVAARLLQRQGLDVTVLEQHTRPGGLLHRFFRDGLAYDTGFHYCGSVDAGQPLGQVLRHIGIAGDLEFEELDPDGFDVLRFPGLEVSMPRGWDAWRERLAAVFPQERAGLDALFARMRAAVDAYGLYRMVEHTDVAHLLDVEGAGLLDVVRAHVRDPRLHAVLAGHAVLYGVPPHEASFGVHALILDHFLQGAFALKGGGDRLALTLARRIRQDGGRVLLKREVTEVICDGRLATGVRVADGEVFPADLVISNLHPRLTLGLLPEQATRKAYRSRVASTRLGHGHLGVYLELEGPVPELERRNLYRHTRWDLERGYQSTTAAGPSLWFACSPSQRRDGDGRSVVLLIAPHAWEDVARWKDTAWGERPAAYTHHKGALADATVRAFLADHPHLAGRIRRVEASTPLTTEHFTRSPEGAMYGHLHSREQMGRARPSARIRVPNVLLVGQGVFSPGVLGTALSAYYAVGHLFGLGPLLDELRSA